jgi:Fe-S oxidoreductase
LSRKEFFIRHNTHLSFLPASNGAKTDLLYFAGCMTHLTPSIIQSMLGIFRKAEINYRFMDEEKTVCCGRPMMLAGKEIQAREMMDNNRQRIEASGAKTLVTSCPICYRVFKEEYNLKINVVHHTTFLLDLIKTGKIPLQSYFHKVAYHDPCDLGRGTNEYTAPRELLGKVSDLVAVDHQNNDSLCCGGSLGMFAMPQSQRDEITKEALKNLLKYSPEIVATGCPLCKKTFSKFSSVDVKDISEIVYESIPG